jgi:hypothetical protein
MRKWKYKGVDPFSFENIVTVMVLFSVYLLLKIFDKI